MYDESGWISENYAVTTGAFCLQNADFKLGKDLDMELLPKNIPNQLLFCSSASSVDSYFYSIYKQWSKMMFAGSDKHFVADLDCEVIIGATNHGKKLYVPLLTYDKVEDAMKQNKEKGMREYYNKFTTEGGSNQPIKRAEIIKNSVVRVPHLLNINNESKKFGLAYDPARSYDNSVITVGEFVYDEEIGYKLIIQNCVSLVDIGKKKKTPMRTPEQISHLKQMLLDYNGKGFADYENIDYLLIDSGAGGAGVNIADYFMEDWVDNNGNTHKGLIDKVESEEYVKKFPNAMDKLKLVSPKKYRTEMYDALIEMLNLGLVEFTETYDNKGFILIPEMTGKDIVEYKKVNLDSDEELALRNIDIAKEEMVQTYRFDSTNGGYRYDLPSDKKSTLHDDRLYTIAMLAWRLKNLRRENITNKKREKNNDISKILQFKQPIIKDSRGW